MKNKRIPMLLVSSILVLGLVSCGQGGASSSLESSSESTSTSSSEATKELVITQASSTIKVGQAYVSSQSFTVKYDGEDVYTEKKKSRVSFVISDGTNTYDGTTALQKAGTYTVKAKYRISNSFSAESNELSLKVADQTSSTTQGFAQKEDYFADNETIYKLKQVNKNPCLKSTGTQKILVVPVQLADETFSSDTLTKIDKAFFGKNEETSWRSLEGFYKESSYGRLDITGTVTKPLTMKYTAAEMLELKGSDPELNIDKKFQDYWNVSWLCLDTAVKGMQDGSLKSEADDTINTKDYDLDGDGYIDAVWMIYSHAYDPSNTGTWWAWTHHDYTKQDTPNVDNPVGYNLCWASQRFISQGYYSDGIDIDVHTLVHETGHLLGLNDYYSTSSATSGNYEGVAGGVDIMDENVGDHNACSKLLFNWIKPIYVDGTQDSCEVTLKPFEESGDVLLVRDADNTDPWNGIPFDEYMTFQFYTPTGLNERDVGYYPEWAAQGVGTYDIKGVQAFHVDNRILRQHKIDEDNYDLDYTDFINDENTDDDETFDGATNSPSSTRGIVDDKLVSGNGCYYRQEWCITADGTNAFQNMSDQAALMKKYNKNTTLFTEGSTFNTERSISTFGGTGKFNDGTTFGYTISVKSITDKGATLLVVKN